jgi:hypothetical protein
MIVQDNEGKEIGCFGLPFYFFGEIFGCLVAAPFAIVEGFVILLNLPGKSLVWLIAGGGQPFLDYLRGKESGDTIYDSTGKGCAAICISIAFWGGLLLAIFVIITLIGFSKPFSR